MGKLKPCPFCGGNAELGGDDAHEYAVVYCEECGNSTDGYLVDECGYHHASEAWNRRTPEEALTEINRLQSEENKKLAEDNAKLIELVKMVANGKADDGESAIIHTRIHADAARELLEKHK